jgi:hypothetical protein
MNNRQSSHFRQEIGKDKMNGVSQLLLLNFFQLTIINNSGPNARRKSFFMSTH